MKIHFASLSLFGAMALTAAFAESSAPKTSPPPPQPPVTLPAWVNERHALKSEDVLASATRSSRSRRFNSLVGEPLEQASADSHIAGATFQNAINLYPISASDIVLARGESAQPYVSEDHRRIYSDLDFGVSAVMKAKGNLVPGTHINICQAGGTTTLPSGKVVHSAPIGGSHVVSLGIPYLLFLNYLPEAACYEVEQAWNVSLPQPIAEDPNGNPLSSRSLASYGHATPATLDDLLSTVRARIGQL